MIGMVMLEPSTLVMPVNAPCERLIPVATQQQNNPEEINTKNGKVEKENYKMEQDRSNHHLWNQDQGLVSYWFINGLHGKGTIGCSIKVWKLAKLLKVPPLLCQPCSLTFFF